MNDTMVKDSKTANNTAAKKQPKVKKKKAEQEQIHLPAVLEFMYSFSGNLIVMVGLAAACVAYLSGANFGQIIMRTAIALIATGIMILLIAWLVSASVYEAARQQMQEEEAAAREAAKQQLEKENTEAETGSLHDVEA
jgi:hypothetical protein